MAVVWPSCLAPHLNPLPRYGLRGGGEEAKAEVVFPTILRRSALVAVVKRLKPALQRNRTGRGRQAASSDYS
jgi:hypothetical protein